VAEAIVIPERFNGPSDSGNGGYSCGAVGALVGNPAAVSLRAPPPLERELAVERRDGAVVVRDGDTLVAEGRPAGLELEPPEPVGLDDARSASERGYARWSDSHPFPTCVVCGPDREPLDGFRIFPGEVEGRDVFAAPWTPDDSLAGNDGLVRPECVWAALDCPTSAPVALYEAGRPIVLAQLAVSIERPPRAGEPHVLMSWRLGVDGRKRRGAAALYGPGGELLALSEALWIELRAGSKV
jgi:hypothetical protein